MNFNSVFSAGKAPESPEEVQELLKNIIIITNYLPGIRTDIGWRGIFRIPGEYESWTFKIAGFEGVFGLEYSGLNENSICLNSTFDIYYFPSGDEDLIEKFSINGAVYAFTDNYRELIRQFPELPEFSGYFNIGKLNITYDPQNPSITIGIDSMSEDVIISVDGIRAGDENSEFIVKPGDAEQNIPSYMLCSAVFEILVSSLSYHAGEKPSGLKLVRSPGRKGFFSEGVLRHEQCEMEITLNSLTALFTDNKEMIKIFSADSDPGGKISPVIWTDEMPHIPDEFKRFRFFKTDKVSSISLNRSLLGIEIKPPLYVVSGFLGSGKTTFIKNFLEFQAQKYLFGAVIQNELGEAGLDGKLISDECRVVEMDEGCVCCSLSGNLRKGINKIISEFVPDFILLETTGAANPMNLISEIHDLRDILKFDSVTTIIDSVNILESLKNYTIAMDQIKSADIIILNKTDGLGPQQIDDIKKKVTGINPRAMTAQAEFGRINPSLLYDMDVNVPGSNHTIQYAIHNHSNHSDDGLGSITIKLPDRIDRKQFIDKINLMSFNIFRMKGFIKFTDTGESSLFQYVAGRYDLTAYNQNIDQPFIVLIGMDIEKPEVSEYFRF